MAKNGNLPEFIELKRIVETKDESRFIPGANDLFEVIQNSPTMKPGKKLEVYDLISKLSNCHHVDRIKYIKKINKYIK